MSLLSIPILFSWGCDGDGGIGPGVLRFGWIGSVSILLEAPIPTGTNLTSGTLTQRIDWTSSGTWTLREAISYRGLEGDASTRTVSAFGDAYARFITQINDTPGLVLFNLPDLPSGIFEEVCAPTFTRITVTIEDETREEVRTWTQCADGRLSTLVTAGAGPEAEAARLVQAAMLVRDATVGPEFVSDYNGSVPFGTIARGEDSNAAPNAPFVISDQAAWQAFWLDHAGSTAAPPVDFDAEVVVVAAVGARNEAGVELEVRRILRVVNGTRTHIVERVPGDFCSPVARVHVPFHVVVAPITPQPMLFADVTRELVPCGG